MVASRVDGMPGKTEDTVVPSPYQARIHPNMGEDFGATVVFPR